MCQDKDATTTGTPPGYVSFSSSRFHQRWWIDMKQSPEFLINLWKYVRRCTIRGWSGWLRSILGELRSDHTTSVASTFDLLLTMLILSGRVGLEYTSTDPRHFVSSIFIPPPPQCTASHQYEPGHCWFLYVLKLITIQLFSLHISNYLSTTPISYL